MVFVRQDNSDLQHIETYELIQHEQRGAKGNCSGTVDNLLGREKHQGQRRQERLLSNDRDCVPFQRLTAYHLFLDSHFNSNQKMIKFFVRHLTKFIGNMPPPITARAFVGYLSFFLGKFRQADSCINHLALKMCLELTLDMKQKLLPRNKIKKNYPIHAVGK